MGFTKRREPDLEAKQLGFHSPSEADLAHAPLWTDDYSDSFSVVKR
jgi:hypothetical protein